MTGPSPQFAAPWQAQVFSLVVALQDACVFTPAEWAGALGAAIQRAHQAGDPDLGDTYYEHWVEALESLLAKRGVASREQIHALMHAWQDAAERTPHGKPIALSDEERAMARETS